jgi:signal transduction histidine kinase
MRHQITNTKPMQVMIVDDNKDNVELMQQILEDEFGLITAYSGYECIEKATTEQPDLILLDVNMPEMDGYETMQRLQQDKVTQNIPVIFASAYYTEPSMIVRGLEQGAFDYLTKPVNEDILLAKVHVVKRIKQAEDEIRQQKNELQLTNDKLKSVDKLKSIFLASMSHELRTPLNSIIGFTGLMLMQIAGTINDGQKEQLNRVKRNADHLLELINDVLDISKIEAGKVDLSITEFDIATLVNEIAQSIEPEASAKGIKLEVKMPDKSIMIKNDSRRIRQILMNFMSNALKFTMHGSIHIELIIENSQNIIIAIKDTGIGIHPNDMEILFEPFQQVSSQLTKNYKGTGLGLYLCKKLSSLVGGDIQATSVLGKSSKFTLIVPVEIKAGGT